MNSDTTSLNEEATYFGHDDPATSDRMMCLRGPINGLLLCTKPVRWRVPLQRFLTDYSSLDDPLREGLVFISTMISEARSLKYQEPNQLVFLPLGADDQPRYFHVDRWRHLMQSLGFILEEPETPYTDLHLCSVFLHEMMPSPMLHGFHVLLRCLTVLSAEQIHAILDMSQEDADCLLFALKATEDKSVNISAFMHTLWDSHSELLTSLGYQHAPHPNYLHQYIHTEYHGGTDYIGRIGPDELGPRAAHQLYPLPQAYAVLLAFHGHAPDVVAETPV